MAEGDVQVNMIVEKINFNIVTLQHLMQYIVLVEMEFSMSSTRYSVVKMPMAKMTLKR